MRFSSAINSWAGRSPLIWVCASKPVGVSGAAISTVGGWDTSSRVPSSGSGASGLGRVVELEALARRLGQPVEQVVLAVDTAGLQEVGGGRERDEQVTVAVELP